MKKIFYCTLSVAFLTVALTSCGKSSKGKMANEWKVTEYKQTQTDVDADGDKTVTTTTMTETSTTETTETTPSGGSTSTSTALGTVNSNTMTIEKDGTWTSTTDLTNAGSGYSIKTTTTSSGTWAFIGKTKGDDFKKNERVMFNKLAESNTTVSTILGQTTTTTSSDTYMTGERATIYTVTESKKDELQLEAEMGSTNTSGSNTSSMKGTTTITLSAK